MQKSFLCALVFGLIAVTVTITPLRGNAQTLDTQLQNIESSRRDVDNKSIKIGLVIESAGASKAVFLVLPTVQTPIGSNQAAATPSAHEPRHLPMYRNRTALIQSGIALVWMGWPSESNFGISGVYHPDFQKDIAAVVATARNRWPNTPLILVGSDGASRTALSFALNRRESIDGMLILAPFWTNDRHLKVESLKSLKTLVLQDSSNECLTVSAIEVIEISERAGFLRIPVNPSKLNGVNNCGVKSSNWMESADASFSETISKWLGNQPMPSRLGSDEAVRSVNERVVMLQGRSGKLETTLFTPNSKGPFPVVIFNHGDVGIDHPSIKQRSRFVETALSAPFLRTGIAVAIPSRPGVGRSDGFYSFAQYSISDGDPTYKARQKSQAVLDAIEGLRTLSDIDSTRVLLSGQSAGGDAVMYLSTQAIDGVKGVINFSGGRSNHRADESPSFENKLMISGWEILGKQAIHPTLLVFAENDSRYTANTIRKSTQAYIENGGKAELLLLPAISGDGHFVYRRPDLWTGALIRFLDGLGFKR